MSARGLKTLWVNILCSFQILEHVSAWMVLLGPLGCHPMIHLSAALGWWSGCQDSGQAQEGGGRIVGIWEGWLGLTFSWNTER